MARLPSNRISLNYIATRFRSNVIQITWGNSDSVGQIMTRLPWKHKKRKFSTIYSYMKYKVFNFSMFPLTVPFNFS